MKEIRIGRPGRLLFTAVFVLLLGACSLTIGTSPNAYPFPSEKVFSVRPDVAANITNFYTEPEVVELERNVYSDLQLFTATAVTMVQRELELKDVRMSADAEKTVVLKMAFRNGHAACGLRVAMSRCRRYSETAKSVHSKPTIRRRETRCGPSMEPFFGRSRVFWKTKGSLRI